MRGEETSWISDGYWVEVEGRSCVVSVVEVTGSGGDDESLTKRCGKGSSDNSSSWEHPLGRVVGAS